MKHIVVLTGAGMSAESGVKTFRDHDGLWEGHDVMKVASPEGFRQNPELVLDFYNQRRRQLKEVQPNDAHKAIAALEEQYKVTVVTQNIDDLHERAGSTDVVHLHGELRKIRSSGNTNDIHVWTEDLHVGDTCKKGYQLRPHVVWFGEDVPMMDTAIKICYAADILIIIGTSMQVYPAASLIHYVQPDTAIYYIDPRPAMVGNQNIKVIAKTATEGMKHMLKLLK
ncbi:SIR2 family NAD-dependent protein deacylase [Winogradskyella aquimaris]|uniref:NAD-dependent protein deacylase n=1 Tax=Winogradskyella aquimaris TaxID=864074 RepID=A0ABU5EMV3_9FLAO|nr:NAD-dependent deacylase [Winogradskyella aquimaris]MDY2587781.1 NAD-dependent deacylase [Winogradskyella aquimaris]